MYWGTRATWRKLNCLNPNLQKMQLFHPPERRLKPVPPPALARHAGERTPREAERFTVSEFKEMSGAPKSR